MDWCRTQLSTISKKVANNPYFHETFGGTSKTCTLHFKGQKNVVGEGKYQKEANFCA